MSTRCQVHVVENDGNQPWERLTLYHHCDGYASNMLPLIASAFKARTKGWEGGRAGKVASFLCAADPGQFEPEPGHELHGDIEWYYRLWVKEHHDVEGRPITWEIEVFDPDTNTGTHLAPGRLLLARMSVEDAAKGYDKFEDAMYPEDER